VESDVQPSDIDPGPCPHCGGELKWKATVGAEKTPQTHFYQCETCDHIHTVEQKLDYAADRTLE
jgi:phage terminase large subunit GpA-like protein